MNYLGVDPDALARRRARTPALVSLRVTREAERGRLIRRLAELSRPIAPATTCQFPVIDAPFTPCGAASVPGMSWCPEHRAICFRGAAPASAAMTEPVWRRR
jgi:hypothetical protein